MLRWLQPAFFPTPRVIIFPDRAAFAAIQTARVTPRAVLHETLPFTMPDVVAYFSGGLMMKASYEGATAVFTSTPNGHAEDIFRIGVTPELGALVVAFRGGCDYRLTLGREFFEGPFFTRKKCFDSSRYSKIPGKDSRPRSCAASPCASPISSTAMIST